MKTSVLNNLDTANQKDLGPPGMRYTFQDKFCLFVREQISPTTPFFLSMFLNKILAIYLELSNKEFSLSLATWHQQKRRDIY